MQMWVPSLYAMVIGRLMHNKEVFNGDIGIIESVNETDRALKVNFDGRSIAIRTYEGLGYSVVGECHMFEQDFLCYEQKL